MTAIRDAFTSSVLFEILYFGISNITRRTRIFLVAITVIQYALRLPASAGSDLLGS